MTTTDAKQITRHAADDWSATFDGEYIGSFKTRHAAEQALNDHSMRLIEDGLVDLPLTLLDAQPCIHCGAVQSRASCDNCVTWSDPPGEPPTPTTEGEDIPTLPILDGALVNWQI